MLTKVKMLCLTSILIALLPSGVFALTHLGETTSTMNLDRRDELEDMIVPGWDADTSNSDVEEIQLPYAKYNYTNLNCGHFTRMMNKMATHWRCEQCVEHLKSIGTDDCAVDRSTNYPTKFSSKGLIPETCRVWGKASYLAF
jgi:hypothetical protein